MLRLLLSHRISEVTESFSREEEGLPPCALLAEKSLAQPGGGAEAAQAADSGQSDSTAAVGFQSMDSGVASGSGMVLEAAPEASSTAAPAAGGAQGPPLASGAPEGTMGAGSGAAVALPPLPLPPAVPAASSSSPSQASGSPSTYDGSAPTTRSTQSLAAEGAAAAAVETAAAAAATTGSGAAAATAAATASSAPPPPAPPPPRCPPRPSSPSRSPPPLRRACKTYWRAWRSASARPGHCSACARSLGPPGATTPPRQSSSML